MVKFLANLAEKLLDVLVVKFAAKIMARLAEIF
jgi:hypothetical protein